MEQNKQTLDEKFRLEYLEKATKANEMPKLEPIVLSKKPQAQDETILETYKNLTRTILEIIEEKLGNNIIIYTSSSATPILVGYSKFEAFPCTSLDGTYEFGALDCISVYVSPYVVDNEIYAMDDTCNIVKLKLVD